MSLTLELDRRHITVNGYYEMVDGPERIALPDELLVAACQIDQRDKYEALPSTNQYEKVPDAITAATMHEGIQVHRIPIEPNIWYVLQVNSINKSMPAAKPVTNERGTIEHQIVFSETGEVMSVFEETPEAYRKRLSENNNFPSNPTSGDVGNDRLPRTSSRSNGKSANRKNGFKK